MTTVNVNDASHDFSPAATNIEMTAVSPPRIEMTEEIQSTCGYKCGQCCLHCCCTIKYDCFSKKSKCKCTPYTTSQGAAATTGVGGAMTHV